MSAQIAHRYPEIDVWRGLAVLGMVLQHSVEIGLFFHTGNPGYVYADAWIEVVRAIGRVSAVSFLLLVGMSAHLSYLRREAKGASALHQYKHFFLRGCLIFGWGMVITGISWWLFPEGYIRFGILHLIGLAVAVAPVAMYTWVRRLLLVLAVALPHLIPQFQPNSELWALLGRYPQQFSSLDHWPIIPWLAVVLVGIEIGRWMYPSAVRRVLPLLKTIYHVAQTRTRLIWIGQHALLIYLTHVPLLVACWYLAQLLTQ